MCNRCEYSHSAREHFPLLNGESESCFWLLGRTRTDADSVNSDAPVGNVGEERKEVVLVTKSKQRLKSEV
jgi:hypothetical protein